MRYLKLYEQFDNEIIRDCKDILIDLSDDDIEYEVGGDKILIINIGDNIKRIELKKYADNFLRLFDYLESLGYILSEKSYYEGDGWDYYERCPYCNSNNITTGDDKDLKCNSCGHEDYFDVFSTREHPLTKGELMWSVKSGDKPDHIYLEFTK